MIKKERARARETVQELRAQTAFPEGLRLTPSTHTAAHNHL